MALKPENLKSRMQRKAHDYTNYIGRTQSIMKPKWEVEK